jgi:hypothetical protein
MRPLHTSIALAALVAATFTLSAHADARLSLNTDISTLTLTGSDIYPGGAPYVSVAAGKNIETITSAGIEYTYVEDPKLSYTANFGFSVEDDAGKNGHDSQGWNAGGGINYALSNFYSVGAGYQYYDTMDDSVTSVNFTFDF